MSLFLLRSSCADQGRSHISGVSTPVEDLLHGTSDGLRATVAKVEVGKDSVDD